MGLMDIIILVVIGLNGLLGLRKGFIVSVFNFVGFILAIYIARMYYPVASKFIINNPNFIGKVKDFVSGRVNIIADGVSKSDGMDSIVEAFKLPNPINEGIINNSSTIIETGKANIANSLTAFFINILSMIIIFLIARLIIHLLVGLLNSFAKLPVLKQFNSTAGLAFGVLKGVLLVYILFAVLTPIISMYPDGKIAGYTYQSTLGQFFYKKNIIINFIKSLDLYKIA